MSYSHEKRELELYIDNDGQLYAKRLSILKNVARRVVKGTYDATKAPKLWLYLIDAGAKKYVKEFGGAVTTMFPKKLRMELAEEYAKAGLKEVLAELRPQRGRS